MIGHTDTFCYIRGWIKKFWLVVWLVVLRINVDLAIFQPYLDLEAGDNQSLKIQVARPGIEPRSSCSAQKVLKLVAYLHKYTAELHQTYTEYVTTISWFVNVVRMTQYARGYMTSSFNDVMQQWPGVKNVRHCLFPAKCNYQHSCLIWPLFFRDYYGLDEAP